MHTFFSVAAAGDYASKGLDKLGEKLPLLQKPVEQVRVEGWAGGRAWFLQPGEGSRLLYEEQTTSVGACTMHTGVNTQ